MNNTEQGIILVFFGTIFLLMSLEMLDFNFRIIEPGISTILAVIAFSYGIYQISKGN
jgi:hypothetical protein